MGAFVIVLREAFEASLVIGLVLAFLAKTGQLQRHSGAVWQGTAAAVAVSAALGGLLFVSIGELDGTAEKLYEGAAMLLACGVLTWMLFWMRRQAATIGGHLRSQVAEAVSAGGGIALATVAFIAVTREGIETALFLFVSVGESGLVQTVVGGVLGLAVAVGLGIALYRGSIKLDLGRFFLVTGLLVIAFAAYLLFGAVHELSEATGGEALELLAPVAAAAFALFFGRLYLTKPKQRPARAPAERGVEEAAAGATRPA
jgi:high-affinity iron transporter